MPPARERRRVLVFATKGAGSNDETRIRELLSDHDVDLYEFHRENKAGNVTALLRRIARSRPDLIVMEGTGLAGGVVLLTARAVLGVPYVVSSGDAIGPFLGATHRWIGFPGWLYEALLTRFSTGFIAWTPYLAGRALTLGSRRTVTAAGFAQQSEVTRSREAVRKDLGISESALVVGIVGSLDWSANRGYCYGYELVRAVRQTQRADVAALIVGGGSGIERLRELAGDELGRRIFIPGPIEQALVPSYLGAMDVGSLPQSIDQVGAFRYTTKISEYVDARLPIVTGQLPFAYDLAFDWVWRLPGGAPWDEIYIAALSEFLERLDHRQTEELRERLPTRIDAFDARHQAARVNTFIAELPLGRDR